MHVDWHWHKMVPLELCLSQGIKLEADSNIDDNQGQIPQVDLE